MAPSPVDDTPIDGETPLKSSAQVKLEPDHKAEDTQGMGGRIFNVAVDATVASQPAGAAQSSCLLALLCAGSRISDSPVCLSEEGKQVAMLSFLPSSLLRIQVNH